MADAAKILLVEGDAPATPASGSVSIYPKTDHNLYVKGSDGIERQVTSVVAFGVMFGGDSTEIVADSKCYLSIPFACTLISWRIVADVGGAVKIDVWKDTYANYPPTDGDSMCNGHEPEIAATADKAEDTNLGDWTTVTVSAGDCLVFNVDSCTDITQATLILMAQR